MYMNYFSSTSLFMFAIGIPISAQSFKIALKACYDTNDIELALSVLSEMKKQGLTPESHSYAFAVFGLVKKRRWQEARKVMRAMLESGHQHDLYLYQNILRLLGLNQRRKEAKEILKEMVKKVSCTAMMMIHT